jgi:hypothetical protein
MSAEERARVARLSQLGAMHYQAEEDFLNMKIVKRSHTVPLVNLAERYRRLRSSSSITFGRCETDSALHSPIQSSHGHAKDLVRSLGALKATRHISEPTASIDEESLLEARHSMDVAPESEL